MPERPSHPQHPPQAFQLQIEIDPATANGVFVNLALVEHTETEFTLDLAYVPPRDGEVLVRARAITTPKHMKRLVNALRDNLAKYEERFGVVLGAPAAAGPGTTSAPRVEPAVASGAFVNMALVNHVETEFTLDLVYVQPQAPKAIVRSRAILTPVQLKRTIAVIQEAIGAYEARHGAIDVAGMPHFPAGGLVN
jgi:hypothetical protein